MNDNAMTLIEPLDTEALSIGSNMELDRVLEIINHIDFVFNEVKAIRAKGQEALLDWVKYNGPFEFNGTKYCEGKTKTTKCINLAGCIELILNRVGGDFGEFVKLLSANAIKPGATKEVLGKDWETYFDVTFKDKIELKKIPTALLK